MSVEIVRIMVPDWMAITNTSFNGEPQWPVYVMVVNYKP
jgi:hypothetical protein